MDPLTCKKLSTKANIYNADTDDDESLITKIDASSNTIEELYSTLTLNEEENKKISVSKFITKPLQTMFVDIACIYLTTEQIEKACIDAEGPPELFKFICGLFLEEYTKFNLKNASYQWALLQLFLTCLLEFNELAVKLITDKVLSQYKNTAQMPVEKIAEVASNFSFKKLFATKRKINLDSMTVEEKQIKIDGIEELNHTSMRFISIDASLAENKTELDAALSKYKTYGNKLKDYYSKYLQLFESFDGYFESMSDISDFTIRSISLVNAKTKGAETKSIRVLFDKPILVRAFEETADKISFIRISDQDDATITDRLKTLINDMPASLETAHKLTCSKSTKVVVSELDPSGKVVTLDKISDDCVMYLLINNLIYTYDKNRILGKKSYVHSGFFIGKKNPLNTKTLDSY